jgi:hypothetical protein
MPDPSLPDLLVACDQGDLDAVHHLVAAGADVRGKYGGSQSTALHIAAYAGQLEVVRYLLTLSVDVNARDAEGCTPLDNAVYRKQEEVARLLRAGGGDEAPARDGRDMAFEEERLPAGLREIIVPWLWASLKVVVLALVVAAAVWSLGHGREAILAGGLTLLGLMAALMFSVGSPTVSVRVARGRLEARMMGQHISTGQNWELGEMMGKVGALLLSGPIMRVGLGGVDKVEADQTGITMHRRTGQPVRVSSMLPDALRAAVLAEVRKAGPGP